MSQIRKRSNCNSNESADRAENCPIPFSCSPLRVGSHVNADEKMLKFLSMQEEDNMNKDNPDQGHLPLLVGFSVLRTGEDTLPGRYDAEQQVWVVDGCDGVRPFVKTAKDLAELATKTFAQPERDDVGSTVVLDASTKTEAKPERDDVVEPTLIALLQLITKTKVRQERDD